MIDIKQFSIEKNFTVVADPKLIERIAQHETMMSNLDEWKSSDTDLITQYAKNYGDFKAKCGKLIEWHVKVITTEAGGKIWNEYFHDKLGIDIIQRQLINLD